jgi:dTMP kinase
MTPACEMLLYMAARAQIVSEIISPSLKKGKIVICDRFLDSTLAYQGYGLGINSKTIKYIGDFVTAGIKPDLTIFLNLATEKGLERCGQVKDRIEKRSFGYHLRVKEGYLKLARQEPTRIKIIRVESSADKTQEKIRKLADRFLEKDVL